MHQSALGAVARLRCLAVTVFFVVSGHLIGGRYASHDRTLFVEELFYPPLRPHLCAARSTATLTITWTIWRSILIRKPQSMFWHGRRTLSGMCRRSLTIARLICFRRYSQLDFPQFRLRDKEFLELI